MQSNMIVSRTWLLTAWKERLMHADLARQSPMKVSKRRNKRPLSSTVSTSRPHPNIRSTNLELGMCPRTSSPIQLIFCCFGLSKSSVKVRASFLGPSFRLQQFEVPSSRRVTERPGPRHSPSAVFCPPMVGASFFMRFSRTWDAD